MNLTSIRTPTEIIRRHFGESLFAARHISVPLKTLLDYGSGAGFPGLPIQIMRPDIAVTLAESNAKKASFLREVIRKLALSTAIYASRVENMPRDRTFSAVTLRAVEHMPQALSIAAEHVGPDSILLIMTTLADADALADTVEGFNWQDLIQIPESESRVILIGRRG